MAEKGSLVSKKTVTGRDVLRVFWAFSRPYKWYVASILFCNTLNEVLSTAVIPLSFKYFTDIMTGASPAIGGLMHALFIVLLFIAGVRTLGLLVNRVALELTNYFEARVMASLESTALERVLDMSYRYFADTFAGALVKKIDRLSASFEVLADLVMSDGWSLVIGSVTIMLVLLKVEPSIAALMLVWSVAMTWMNAWIVRRRKSVDAVRAALDSESGASVSDVFSNATNVKLFAAERRELRSFKGLTRKVYDATKRVWRLTNQADMFRGALFVLLELCVLSIFVNKFTRGEATIGDFVLFQTAIAQLNTRVSQFGRIIRMTTSSTANAKEGVELLESPQEIVDVPAAKDLKVRDGRISFQFVGFSYAGQAGLRNFSLEIEPGEKIALVGPSGAGKSTITKLLLRLYDLRSGKIVVDGQDISHVTQDSLRRAISLVPQEPILFHRSLKENIAYGKPGASMKEIIEAAKKARCHDFISKLPKGYDSEVGERGVKLSGGERQRVAIARAILKNSPILVLDEATSSLDSQSEALVQAAVRELMRGKTVIVIAHRLSTIMQMDRIVVIENWKITDMGTHDALLNKVGTYQRLWEIQAGGFAKHAE